MVLEKKPQLKTDTQKGHIILGPKNHKQKKEEHPRFQVSVYPGQGQGQAEAQITAIYTRPNKQATNISSLALGDRNTWSGK